MKEYYGLEVFYFGKYYADLRTDTQFNRVAKLGDGYDFSCVDLKKVIKRNKIALNNAEVISLKKKLLKDFCVSFDVSEDGRDGQCVVILKKFEKQDEG